MTKYKNFNTTLCTQVEGTHFGQIVLGRQIFDQGRTLGGAVQNLNDSGDQKQTDDESSARLLGRRHGAAIAGRYTHTNTVNRSLLSADYRRLDSDVLQ